MEHLRPALGGLLKDLSVWTTSESAQRALEHVTSSAREVREQALVAAFAGQLHAAQQHFLPLHLTMYRCNFVSLDDGAGSSSEMDFLLGHADRTLWRSSSCISHWRFRAAPFADTVKGLRAAQQRCDAALAAALWRRRQQDNLAIELALALSESTLSDSSDSSSDSDSDA
jgi:hypothetical protein